MSHQVRTHTRRTGSGRQVTVRRHDAADPAAAQRKRDGFERRVLRERQEAAHPDAYPARRTPGQRSRKRGLKPARAKRHARKALRLWRRHKVRAVAYGALALGEITAWAVLAGARKLRRGKKGGRK